MEKSETKTLIDKVINIVQKYFDEHFETGELYIPSKEKEFIIELSQIFSDGKYRDISHIIFLENKIEKEKEKFQDKQKSILEEIEKIKRDSINLSRAERITGLKIKRSNK